MVRTARPLALLLLTASSAAAVSGCGKGASYALLLHPQAPSGQDPFASDIVAMLTIEDAAGVQTLPIGALGAGVPSAEAKKLAALSDAFVGLAVQDGGEDYDATRLLAYGDVGPLTLSDEELELDVLVPAVGGVGGLTTLDGDHAGMLGAIAALDDGSAWLFGGARTLVGTTGGGHARVQSLATLDASSWSTTDVAELPDHDEDGAADARVGLTATVVDTPDGERIFVAGGRPATQSTDGNERDAGLFDPSSGTWEWTTRSMVGRRSEHKAVRLADGQVLLVGGWSGDSVYGPASWELFDPEARAFRADPTPLPNGALGFDVVALADGDALVCGGGAFMTPGPAGTSAQADCVLLSSNATVTPTSSLPVALQGLALVELADGRVLASGGATGDILSGSSALALDRAFVWDPGSEAWTEVGPLETPRMGHRAVPTPDGGALIIGGVQQGGLLAPAFGGPVRCAERYDPVADAFVASDICHAAGSGDRPPVAYSDRHGAFVVSGAGQDDQGGGDLGIVGFGPVW